MDIISYALGKKGMQKSVSDYLDEHLTNPTNPPIDSSLTIAGAAADAKTAGDFISRVKEDFNDLPETFVTKVITLNPSIDGWQRKTGRSTDVNDPQDSTTRIMSVPFLDVDGILVKQVDVTPTTGYKWIIYQSDGTNYIGGFASYTWTETAGTCTILDNAVEIILLVAKTDNSTITTDDYDKVIFSYTVNYAEKSYVDEAFSTYDARLDAIETELGGIYAEKEVTFTESVGQIYYVNGTVGTSTAYKNTSFIPVNAGETYRFTGVLSGVDNNASGVCGYDSSQTYVAGLIGKQYSSRTLYEDIEFVIPEGISYIRACSAVTGTVTHEIELTQIMTDSLEQKVIDAQNDIGQLDITQFNGIANAYAAKKNFAESSNSTRWKNNLTYLPSFIHVSDLHLDIERWKRSVQIADYLGVDGIICSGDMVNAPDDDYVTFTAQLGEIPYLPCIGNHEGRNKTEQYIYEKFIEPLGDSVVFPTGISYPNYYHKDFADKSIRVIVVDQYQGTTSSGSKDKIHFTQEQVTWFCDTLLSTPQGYGVIVEMHSPEETPVKDDAYPKFKQNTLYYWPTSPYKLLSEIVDAFISGTTLSKTYTNSSGSTPATVTVDADFSAKNTGVEFIAFMCGHLHCDNIAYVSNTTNKQLLLNIACGCAWTNRTSTLDPGTNNPYFTELSDLGRAEEGPTQDAVNLYVIDRGTKTVRVVRIGADLTFDLSVKRDYMTIPYAD